MLSDGIRKESQYYIIRMRGYIIKVSSLLLTVILLTSCNKIESPFKGYTILKEVMYKGEHYKLIKSNSKVYVLEANTGESAPVDFIAEVAPAMEYPKGLTGKMSIPNFESPYGLTNTYYRTEANDVKLSELLNAAEEVVFLYRTKNYLDIVMRTQQTSYRVLLTDTVFCIFEQFEETTPEYLAYITEKVKEVLAGVSE